MKKSKTAKRKIERPNHLPKRHNFYEHSFAERIRDLDAVPQFEPTVLSEFGAGYLEALRNVRIYGLDRVSANALSGTPK